MTTVIYDAQSKLVIDAFVQMRTEMQDKAQQEVNRLLEVLRARFPNYQIKIVHGLQVKLWNDDCRELLTSTYDLTTFLHAIQDLGITLPKPEEEP